MKQYISYIYLLVFFLSACDGGDKDVCGNNTDVSVTDKRCQYKVSTLTEEFNGSGGLTVDDEGFIYVADFGNQINNADGKIVSKIDPISGEVSEFVTGLDGPSGNTFDSEGNLIQANIQGNYISKITPEGEVSTIISSGLLSPVGVAVDDQGDIIVCNCGSGNVTKYLSDGSITILGRGTTYRCPNGLTMDNDGNFYVANFSNGNVLKIAPDGTDEVLAVLPGNSNSHLVFDGTDLIYALSRGGNKLYEITLEGEVSLIAGTGSDGNKDGNAKKATFHIPNGIGVSNDGSKIYVVSRIVGTGSPLNPVVVRVITRK
ncbi:MAG: hypothetical protein NXI20_23320 [bacterium]|nr:hypothetical protein [bacterium]